MKSNKPDALKRILYLTNNRFYTYAHGLPHRNRAHERLLSNSAGLASLAAMRAYKAINGDRDIVDDELELCADMAIAILKHTCNPDRIQDETPVYVWDSICVLCGRCRIPIYVFDELYDEFGTDWTVMDLMCYHEPDDGTPSWLKDINKIVREDLTTPNPDEDAMRELVTNITNNIRRAYREGPKERAVDIVIKYYLYEYSIEDLTEMFNLSSATIRMILRCWRDRCHAILGDPHSWDAPFSLGIYIFGNSPYNKEYPEFSFLHRIRFLMMHRAELSRADNLLLNRVLYTLKRYDSSCTVKKEENNE